MPDVSRRRQLVLEDAELDFSVSLDVNEYLIDNWPTLTFANRKSVWHNCDNDEDFDWSSIEDQVDQAVYDLAEADPKVVLPEESEDDDEEENETISVLQDALYEYFQEFWDDMDEDLDDLIADVICKIDEAVDNYYDEDESEPTS